MKKAVEPKHPHYDPLRKAAFFKDEVTPIQRADGTDPYNTYLWPTESWWLGHEHTHYPSRYHFGYIALSCGLFATGGHVWQIRDDNDEGRKCLFPTRAKALRASAARLIRHMRYASRNWPRMGYTNSWDILEGKRLEFAINWTLERVARETGSTLKRRVIIHLPVVTTPIELKPSTPDEFLSQLLDL